MGFSVDFDGSPFLETSNVGSYANRLEWRTEILLARNPEIIKDRRVLDLASHDGRFSYACLALGASHVTGVEGRPHLVERASENLERLGCEARSFKFLVGDAMDFLSETKPGDFDTILCLGFFYHTIRQVEMLQEFNRLEPKYLVLDTYVDREFDLIYWITSRVKGLFRMLGRVRHIKPEHIKRFRKEPGRIAGSIGASVKTEGATALVFKPESHVTDGATIDTIDIVAWPTRSFIETILPAHGFAPRRLHWDKKEIRDWSSIEDYKKGKRVSYLAEYLGG